MLKSLLNRISNHLEINLEIKVTPKSKTNQILEYLEIDPQNFRLKAKIQGAPVKGQVNDKLIDYLASELNLAKSRLSLYKGSKNRLKIIKIHALQQ
ncbi:DUF167 domain-containing protein [Candidatus Peregrinibacteria bacterium]|nr:DUF167 domain-containing protein [Candidatus Peregrinibacteria bacterium]